MTKIFKANKIVIILSGKYAGKKGIVIKTYEEATQDRAYSHALVVGISRYPRKITKKMGKKKTAKRIRVKPFVKAINYNHLLPTRYAIDIPFDKSRINKNAIVDPSLKRRALAEAKLQLEKHYKLGKGRWFFTKLRF